MAAQLDGEPVDGPIGVHGLGGVAAELNPETDPPGDRDGMREGTR